MYKTRLAMQADSHNEFQAGLLASFQGYEVMCYGCENYRIDVTSRPCPCDRPCAKTMALCRPCFTSLKADGETYNFCCKRRKL